jgi:methylamine dehydrogenase heavy chain
MRRFAARIGVVRALVFAFALSGVAGAGTEPETVGKVMSLPARPGSHWFWLSDILLHRTALFDADSGQLLGQISSGTAGVGFVVVPLFSPDHREVYLAETYYSRGVRGERTDVVTVYDAQTLRPVEEIVIPPKRAEYFPGNAANALSDDGRFMAVFNITPATSVSIVDLKARRFTTEIDTPGCSLVFAAGTRRFLMLCANGGTLSVTLDEQGGVA